MLIAISFMYGISPAKRTAPRKSEIPPQRRYPGIIIKSGSTIHADIGVPFLMTPAPVCPGRTIPKHATGIRHVFLRKRALSPDMIANKK